MITNLITNLFNKQDLVTILDEQLLFSQLSEVPIIVTIHYKLKTFTFAIYENIICPYSVFVNQLISGLTGNIHSIDKHKLDASLDPCYRKYFIFTTSSQITNVNKNLVPKLREKGKDHFIYLINKIEQSHSDSIINSINL